MADTTPNLTDKNALYDVYKTLLGKTASEEQIVEGVFDATRIARKEGKNYLVANMLGFIDPKQNVSNYMARLLLQAESQNKEPLLFFETEKPFLSPGRTVASDAFLVTNVYSYNAMDLLDRMLVPTELTNAPEVPVEKYVDHKGFRIRNGQIVYRGENTLAVDRMRLSKILVDGKMYDATSLLKEYLGDYDSATRNLDFASKAVAPNPYNYTTNIEVIQALLKYVNQKNLDEGTTTSINKGKYFRDFLSNLGLHKELLSREQATPTLSLSSSRVPGYAVSITPKDVSKEGADYIEKYHELPFVKATITGFEKLTKSNVSQVVNQTARTLNIPKTLFNTTGWLTQKTASYVGLLSLLRFNRQKDGREFLFDSKYKGSFERYFENALFYDIETAQTKGITAFNSSGKPVGEMPLAPYEVGFHRKGEGFSSFYVKETLERSSEDISSKFPIAKKLQAQLKQGYVPESLSNPQSAVDTIYDMSTKFKGLSKNTFVVGHNISQFDNLIMSSFDSTMLKRQEVSFVDLLTGHVTREGYVDTLTEARKWMPLISELDNKLIMTSGYSLENLASYFNISVDKNLLHTAKFDVALNYRVAEEMFNRVAQLYAYDAEAVTQIEETYSKSKKKLIHEFGKTTDPGAHKKISISNQTGLPSISVFQSNQSVLNTVLTQFGDKLDPENLTANFDDYGLSILGSKGQLKVEAVPETVVDFSKLMRSKGPLGILSALFPHSERIFQEVSAAFAVMEFQDFVAQNQTSLGLHKLPPRERKKAIKSILKGAELQSNTSKHGRVSYRLNYTPSSGNPSRWKVKPVKDIAFYVKNNLVNLTQQLAGKDTDPVTVGKFLSRGRGNPFNNFMRRMTRLADLYRDALVSDISPTHMFDETVNSFKETYFSEIKNSFYPIKGTKLNYQSGARVKAVADKVIHQALEDYIQKGGKLSDKNGEPLKIEPYSAVKRDREIKKLLRDLTENERAEVYTYAQKALNGYVTAELVDAPPEKVIDIDPYDYTARVKDSFNNSKYETLQQIARLRIAGIEVPNEWYSKLSIDDAKIIMKFGAVITDKAELLKYMEFTSEDVQDIFDAVYEEDVLYKTPPLPPLPMDSDIAMDLEKEIRLQKIAEWRSKLKDDRGHTSINTDTAKLTSDLKYSIESDASSLKRWPPKFANSQKSPTTPLIKVSELMDLYKQRTGVNDKISQKIEAVRNFIEYIYNNTPDNNTSTGTGEPTTIYRRFVVSRLTELDFLDKSNQDFEDLVYSKGYKFLEDVKLGDTNVTTRTAMSRMKVAYFNALKTLFNLEYGRDTLTGAISDTNLHSLYNKYSKDPSSIHAKAFQYAEQYLQKELDISVQPSDTKVTDDILTKYGIVKHKRIYKNANDTFSAIVSRFLVDINNADDLNNLLLPSVQGNKFSAYKISPKELVLLLNRISKAYENNEIPASGKDKQLFAMLSKPMNDKEIDDFLKQIQAPSLELMGKEIPDVKEHGIYESEKIAKFVLERHAQMELEKIVRKTQSSKAVINYINQNYDPIHNKVVFRDSKSNTIAEMSPGDAFAFLVGYEVAGESSRGESAHVSDSGLPHADDSLETEFHDLTKAIAGLDEDSSDGGLGRAEVEGVLDPDATPPDIEAYNELYNIVEPNTEAKSSLRDNPIAYLMQKVYVGGNFTDEEISFFNIMLNDRSSLKTGLEVTKGDNPYITVIENTGQKRAISYKTETGDYVGIVPFDFTSSKDLKTLSKLVMTLSPQSPNRLKEAMAIFLHGSSTRTGVLKQDEMVTNLLTLVVAKNGSYTKSFRNQLTKIRDLENTPKEIKEMLTNILKHRKSVLKTLSQVLDNSQDIDEEGMRRAAASLLEVLKENDDTPEKIKDTINIVMDTHKTTTNTSRLERTADRLKAWLSKSGHSTTSQATSSKPITGVNSVAPVKASNHIGTTTSPKPNISTPALPAPMVTGTGVSSTITTPLPRRHKNRRYISPIKGYGSLANPGKTVQYYYQDTFGWKLHLNIRDLGEKDLTKRINIAEKNGDKAEYKRILTLLERPYTESELSLAKEIAQYLNELKGELDLSDGIHYKYLYSAGQEGKDMTIYLGHRDLADEVAKKIDERFGARLRDATGDVLYDDIPLYRKVWGRFEISRKDKRFMQYGAKGHGGLVGLHATAMTEEKKAAYAEKALIDTYGEFYTGSSRQQVPTQAGGSPAPSSSIPAARSPVLDAIEAAEQAKNRLISGPLSLTPPPAPSAKPTITEAERLKLEQELQELYEEHSYAAHAGTLKDSTKTLSQESLSPEELHDLFLSDLADSQSSQAAGQNTASKAAGQNTASKAAGQNTASKATKQVSVQAPSKGALIGGGASAFVMGAIITAGLGAINHMMTKKNEAENIYMLNSAIPNNQTYQQYFNPTNLTAQNYTNNSVDASYNRMLTQAANRLE